jgi:hypothetical protein
METLRLALHVEALLRLFRESRFDEAMDYLSGLDPEVRTEIRDLLHDGGGGRVRAPAPGGG